MLTYNIKNTNMSTEHCSSIFAWLHMVKPLVLQSYKIIFFFLSLNTVKYIKKMCPCLCWFHNRINVLLCFVFLVFMLFIYIILCSHTLKSVTLILMLLFHWLGVVLTFSIDVDFVTRLIAFMAVISGQAVVYEGSPWDWWISMCLALR